MDGKISNLKQIASIQRYTVSEGRAKGLDVIDCNNGKIRFLLNVTKALDIIQLYHEGQNMSFVSKNGFSARENDFINRFEGGMLYTSGIDSICRRDGFDIHGSHHNTHAEIIHAECTENEIVVEAVMNESALFGQNLIFHRKITSKMGSGTLQINDTIENIGYSEANYAMLYHINLGYPMLDEGAEIIADVKEILPCDEFAAQNVNSAFVMTDSVPCQPEMCYYLTLGEPKISLVNKKIGKKFTVSYSKDTLPYFLQWKSMASGDYALGLEPTTTMDDHFEYKTLPAGEKAEFKVKLEIE